MIEALIRRKRLLLTSALFLAALGLVSWWTMPRQEDPSMPQRFGLLVVPYPGADAEKVERLVVRPLEDELARAEEIEHVRATARADAAVLNIELKPSEGDLTAAWDEVERRIRVARAELPDGAGEPSLDRELLDVQTIVLAVRGSPDSLVLLDGAHELEDALLSVRGVKRVELAGAPEESIGIRYDDAAARRFGVSPGQLASQLSARNSALPGGAIRVGERTTTLTPDAELSGVAEIERSPIVLPSGNAVPLSQMATVRREVAEPRGELVRHRGEPAILVGVVAEEGIDIVGFGRDVRERVAGVQPRLGGLTVEEVTFQPARVEWRLRDLSRSLLLGIAIVAGVLVLFMGPRLGLLVASVVPLVALASLAIYAVGGGILQQMSISALVIALGMLVDNAIVVAESVQRKLDEGADRRAAVTASIRELALPLGAATGTTLAAFVPMLLSEGGTADFTRAIPIVIMLTLAVSYVFAILITPVLAGAVLKPRRDARDGSFARFAVLLGHTALRRRVLVLLGTAALLGATFTAAGAVEQQFFPSADREQLIVSIELPEGTYLEATDARARRVEAALAQHEKVQFVTTVVGRSVPRLYYNLPTRPSSPHLAQHFVTVNGPEDVAPVLALARSIVRREIPEAEVIARGFEQGPPVDAPVQVRLYGSDLGQLSTAAEAVLRELRAIEGTRDLRHDLGGGIPGVRFGVDDAVAARRGATRSDVALALLGRTRGLVVGELRTGADPVPILVRGSRGEDLPAAELASIDVSPSAGSPVPLAGMSRLDVGWQPAVIHRRDRERLVTVSAELADGVPFSRVFDQLEPRLAPALPPGVHWEFAGAKEGSGEANDALFTTLPIGIFLLLFILLAEFNSFRRLALVMVTVPLAAVGVVPGLLAAGEPFGFMSMLGTVALIGIVVNNAIVLIDVADRERERGVDVHEALARAVRLRTRPILLTTATTVAGLMPLAFSSATLWPPLAWAMISGLLASTVLTLLVVPALYSLVFRERPAAPPPAEAT